MLIILCACLHTLLQCCWTIAGVGEEWLTVVKFVMNTGLHKGWEFLIRMKTCTFLLAWTSFMILCIE